MPEPFPRFKYRLRLDERPVAGFMEVAGLEVGVGAGQDREACKEEEDISAEYGRFVFKWGLIYDPEFEDWAGWAGDVEGYAQDIILEVLDEHGRTVRTFRFDGCRVTGIVSVPKSNADTRIMAVEALVLECAQFHGR